MVQFHWSTAQSGARLIPPKTNPPSLTPFSAHVLAKKVHGELLIVNVPLSIEMFAVEENYCVVNTYTNQYWPSNVANVSISII